MAVELHTALHLAGITGPYALAGHSFGGLVVRAFADAYRPEMGGLVLVDASHPDQWARWPVPYAHRLQVLSLTVMAALAEWASSVWRTRSQPCPQDCPPSRSPS